MRILAAPCCLLRVNILFPSGSGEALLLPELQSGGLKNSGTENFRKGLPETRQCGRTCPDQPDTLQAAGVQEGEHLTAVAQQAKVAASDCAFVLRLGPSRHGW